jgi:ubiquinone/menaquinone biosynthesis C-methylase UbiE
MTERPNRTSDFFDSYAEDFSAIYGNRQTLPNRIINGLFRKAMRLRYEMTLERCQPLAGRTVIDIGCGPGHFGVALAKGGAARVLGLDFAEGMIELARKNAAEAGVSHQCQFETADFFSYPIKEKFDYAVVMGFMDYMPDPAKVITRVLNVTARRALFSFPLDGGFLAWQRKIRYKSRCELFMYTIPQVERLLQDLTDHRVTVERIDRDCFVTVQIAPNAT